jgi:4-carboxymuconolactone decarboxylase
MAICLGNSRWVSKGLYDRAVKALGITDVITLMGYYTSVSMTLAFYDVPARTPGKEAVWHRRGSDCDITDSTSR